MSGRKNARETAACLPRLRRQTANSTDQEDLRREFGEITFLPKVVEDRFHSDPDQIRRPDLEGLLKVFQRGGLVAQADLDLAEEHG